MNTITLPITSEYMDTYEKEAWFHDTLSMIHW